MSTPSLVSGSKRRALWAGLLSCLTIIAPSISCSSRHYEEIVTTDARRASALPPQAEPITRNTNLPRRDPDLEAAGDRIGEVITYLESKKRDKLIRAGNALNAAENELLQLEHRTSGNAADQNRIRELLKELDVARRSMARNAPETVHQVSELNRQLDSLELETTQADNK
jgi:polyhydroxyalkanoate synthesis regulator phasin